MENPFNRLLDKDCSDEFFAHIVGGPGRPSVTISWDTYRSPHKCQLTTLDQSAMEELKRIHAEGWDAIDR